MRDGQGKILIAITSRVNNKTKNLDNLRFTLERIKFN
jgi:hypothetical protein